MTTHGADDPWAELEWQDWGEKLGSVLQINDDRSFPCERRLVLSAPIIAGICRVAPFLTSRIRQLRHRADSNTSSSSE